MTMCTKNSTINYYIVIYSEQFCLRLYFLNLGDNIRSKIKQINDIIIKYFMQLFYDCI